MNELFKSWKPVIGVVHLQPLPGAPRYQPPFVTVVERALRDAKTYEEGGVNAIILENFGDAPYHPDRVGPETVAAMTYVASRVKEAVNIPIGINVLRNDALSALAIAYVVGASFIRVNVLSGATITDQGIITSKAHHLLRYRRFLEASGVKVFADINVKHSVQLLQRPLELVAEELVQRELADAVIVTGETTGRAPGLEQVKAVKKVLPNTPVLVGSGVNEENVQEYLKLCDGVIVGTSLKTGGATENPVDLAKVKALIAKANPLTKLSTRRS
ncbi:MAG: BtpA/SgcQ family protein [Candidatus Nezhaarchaeales archaeon]